VGRQVSKTRTALDDYCCSRCLWYEIIYGGSLMGWVSRMLKWDWFLAGIYIAFAKVGPEVN
jgi:hypothetical protein